MKESFEAVAVEVIDLDSEFALCESCNWFLPCEDDTQTCEMFF